MVKSEPMAAIELLFFLLLPVPFLAPCASVMVLKAVQPSQVPDMFSQVKFLRAFNNILYCQRLLLMSPLEQPVG